MTDIGVRNRFNLCRACSRAPYSRTGKINSFVFVDLHTNSILNHTIQNKYLVNYKYTHSKVLRAAAASFDVLKPGGRWRIAVPDAYFPKYLNILF